MDKTIINKLQISLALLGVIASVSWIISEIYVKELSNKSAFNSILEPIAAMIGVLTTLVFTIFKYKKEERLNVKKVFILYSDKDKELVNKLIIDLQNIGNQLKLLKDDDILSIGDDITKKTEATINEIDRIIVVISKNSITSKFIINEIKKLKNLNKKIFPVLVDEYSKNKMPEEILNIQYADLSNSNEISMQHEKLYNSLIFES